MNVGANRFGRRRKNRSHCQLQKQSRTLLLNAMASASCYSIHDTQALPVCWSGPPTREYSRQDASVDSAPTSESRALMNFCHCQSVLEFIRCVL